MIMSYHLIIPILTCHTFFWFFSHFSLPFFETLETKNLHKQAKPRLKNSSPRHKMVSPTTSKTFLDLFPAETAKPCFFFKRWAIQISFSLNGYTSSYYISFFLAEKFVSIHPFRPLPPSKQKQSLELCVNILWYAQYPLNIFSLRRLGGPDFIGKELVKNQAPSSHVPYELCFFWVCFYPPNGCFQK